MGVKLESLEPASATRFLYALRVDDYMTAFTSRADARTIMRHDLDAVTITTASRLQRRASAEAPVPSGPVQRDGYRFVTPAEIEEARKTWGLLPEHQEGLRQAVAVGKAAGT